MRGKSKVPAIPAWLVDRAACSLDNDALLGDLAERFANGRSPAWYWKQAAVSIMASLFAQIRREPLTILRGVTAGWLIYWPLGYVMFHFGFYELALDSLQIDNPDLLIGSWAPPVWYHTAKFGTIYTYGANVIATALMVGICIFSGWILSALFRPSSRAVLLVFSVTVLVSWAFYSATLGGSVAGATLPWSLYFWMNSILQTVGILAGGSRGRARRLSMAS
jgi:hypothetical protein